MKKQYIKEDTVSGAIATTVAPLGTMSRMYQAEGDGITVKKECEALASNALLVHEKIKAKKDLPVDTLTLLKQANNLLQKLLK